MLAQLPTDDCTTAPILCDLEVLDGYSFIMSPSITQNGPSPLCHQGGAPDNVHWFAFYAWCPQLSLTLFPSNCTTSGGQTGVQAAVYFYGGDGLCINSTWQPLQAVACNVTPCFDEPWQMELNLQIGQLYYFMVNGCTGTACDISITVNTICPPPQIGPWPGPIQGSTYVCRGSTTSLIVPPPEGAVDYTWSIDGNVVQDFPFNQVAITWTEAGIYALCVEGSNQCVPKQEGPVANCIQVEVYDVVPEDPEPVYVCEGDTAPYPGGPYGPGEYVIQLTSAQGCDSTVTFRVLEKPTVYNELGRYVLCGGDSLSVGGTTYTCADAGEKLIYLQPQEPSDCHSFLVFDIVCFQAHINQYGNLSPPQNAVVLEGDMGINATGGYFTYTWSTVDGQLPSVIDLPSITVSEPGTYCLLVQMYGSDASLLCEDQVCKEIPSGFLMPGTDCYSAPIICITDTIYNLAMSPEITFNGPSPICHQGGAPHNTHWLAFYAPCDSLQITFFPSDCIEVDGQIGVQAMVYRYAGDGICMDTKAQPEQVVACQSIPCFTTPWTLSMLQLEVGQLYYLMVDGCAGSYCDLTIQFGTPCHLPTDPFAWEGLLAGPSRVCEGDLGIYLAPPALVLSSYYWYINDSLIATTSDHRLSMAWESEGLYELCVTWDHPCLDPMGEEADRLCKQVMVNGVKDFASRDIYVCQGDEGLHQGVYWNCDFDGEQVIHYQQEQEPYCDSLVQFEVVCLDPEALIFVDLQPDSTALLDGSQSKGGPVGTITRFYWTASEGGVIDGPTDAPLALALTPGRYCLTVEVLSPNEAISCTHTTCVDVDMEGGNLRYHPASSTADPIRLWPQPASDHLYILIPSSTEMPVGQLTIFTVLGEPVYQQVFAAGSLHALHTQGWADGLYPYRWTSDDHHRVQTGMILIQR